jgi:hypothetical protein
LLQKNCVWLIRANDTDSMLICIHNTLYASIQNRPADDNPGIRSSQYAAESSCRTRYGELSEWMTFIDTDEYLVCVCLRYDKFNVVSGVYFLTVRLSPFYVGSYETKRGR